MNPAQRAPYIELKAEFNRRYNAELQAFNARVPLSPSIGSNPDHSDSGLSEDEFEHPNHDSMYDEWQERRATQKWNRYRRDHPRACGGGALPVPNTPFRFLDLLPKIRAKIYRNILPQGSGVMQMEPDGSAGDSERGPIDVRIFAVSKQVYDEATDIFFQENVVILSLADDAGADLPPPMFRDIPQGPSIAKLKKVEISFSMNKALEAPRLEWHLRRLCSSLSERSQLTQVEVYTTAQKTWYKPELDMAIDRLLELLEVIRGVTTVHFVTDAELFARGGGMEHRVIGTQAQKDRIRDIMTSPEQESPRVS